MTLTPEEVSFINLPSEKGISAWKIIHYNNVDSLFTVARMLKLHSCFYDDVVNLRMVGVDSRVSFEAKAVLVKNICLNWIFKDILEGKAEADFYMEKYLEKHPNEKTL